MAGNEEDIGRPARHDGVCALEQIEMLARGVAQPMVDANKVLRGIKSAIFGLISENDDLLEGYMKVAGEAAILEDKVDLTKAERNRMAAKHKRAERACAHMGAKLTAQRNTLLDAVAAAAGRREY